MVRLWLDSDVVDFLLHFSGSVVSQLDGLIVHRGFYIV